MGVTLFSNEYPLQFGRFDRYGKEQCKSLIPGIITGEETRAREDSRVCWHVRAKCDLRAVMLVFSIFLTWIAYPPSQLTAFKFLQLLLHCCRGIVSMFLLSCGDSIPLDVIGEVCAVMHTSEFSPHQDYLRNLRNPSPFSSFSLALDLGGFIVSVMELLTQILTIQFMLLQSGDVDFTSACFVISYVIVALWTVLQVWCNWGRANHMKQSHSICSPWNFF